MIPNTRRPLNDIFDAAKIAIVILVIVMLGHFLLKLTAIDRNIESIKRELVYPH